MKSNRKDEVTCVQLAKETKARLDKLGTKNQTYDSIIQELLDSSCVKTEDGEQDESEEESS